MTGSPDVSVGGQPVLRIGDQGVHQQCCGANLWLTYQASSHVLVNNVALVRVGDRTIHCGGIGAMITGVASVEDGSPGAMFPVISVSGLFPPLSTDAVKQMVEDRKAALEQADLGPEDTSKYDTDTALGTVFENPTNRHQVIDMAGRYGVPPSLVAGVVASEMDFDHDSGDWFQDGLGRLLGGHFGDGPGIGSVHKDSLERAVEYLEANDLTGAAEARAYLDNYGGSVNPSEFNSSVEGASIVAAMYHHLHGGASTSQDMAVIWGGYRSGVMTGGDTGEGYTLDGFRANQANGAPAGPFQIGKNAYMSQPLFEYLIRLFGDGVAEPMNMTEWKCCGCSLVDRLVKWSR